jgi:hypothetical protein
MIIMKIVTVLNIFLLGFLHASSQFCYDTFQRKNQNVHIVPSVEFTNYSAAFLKLAKEKQLTEIDTSCKGGDRPKSIIEELDKGFECLFFSNNQKVFSIDSYCKQNDLNINFGLLEIVYSSSNECKKAIYNVFHQRIF